MLFKYLPTVRLDVIENLKIRFSLFRSLNDPFEACPLVDISKDINPAVFGTIKELADCWENAPELLSEKPMEWGYEEEERLYLNHIDSRLSTGKDDYGMDVILTDIPKGAISSIYFGLNSSEDVQDRIWKALNRHDIHASVYQARISDSEYKIEFETLER